MSEANASGRPSGVMLRGKDTGQHSNEVPLTTPRCPVSRSEAGSGPSEVADRQDQASRYLDLVWAGQQGFGSWAIGHGGRFVGNRYHFSQGIRQHFESWPPEDEAAGAVIAERLIRASNFGDIFVAPLLRSSAARAKGNGLPGRFLYADLDRPRTPEQERLLNRLLAKGRSFRVDSGRHEHVYVEVDQKFSLPVFTEYNRRLSLAVNGDSKWDDTALLRLPGTLNHKGRALGVASYPVRFKAPQ